MVGMNIGMVVEGAILLKAMKPRKLNGQGMQNAQN
jgi:hypothetical protein